MVAVPNPPTAVEEKVVVNGNGATKKNGLDVASVPKPDFLENPFFNITQSLEKKLRNLEKRRTRLQELKEIKEKLSLEQQEAVALAPEVENEIEYLKTLNQLVNKELKNYRKEHKKKSKAQFKLNREPNSVSPVNIPNDNVASGNDQTKKEGDQADSVDLSQTPVDNNRAISQENPNDNVPANKVIEQSQENVIDSSQLPAGNNYPIAKEHQADGVVSENALTKNEVKSIQPNGTDLSQPLDNNQQISQGKPSDNLFAGITDTELAKMAIEVVKANNVRRNFRQRNGDDRRSFRQEGDANNRRNFRQRSDDNRPNLRQGSNDNNRRTFRPKNDDNRKSLHQEGDENNRRGFQQKNNDDKNFLSYRQGSNEENRRNLRQDGGDNNRRNFRQENGENNRRSFRQRNTDATMSRENNKVGNDDNRRKGSNDDNRRNFQQTANENNRRFTKNGDENNYRSNRQGNNDENRRNFQHENKPRVRYPSQGVGFVFST